MEVQLGGSLEPPPVSVPRTRWSLRGMFPHLAADAAICPAMSVLPSKSARLTLGEPPIAKFSTLIS